MAISRNIIFSSIVMFSAFLLNSPGYAQLTQVGTLGVQVSVFASCTVSGATGALSFDNIPRLMSIPGEATTDIGYTCTPGTTLRIDLDRGLIASYATHREMTQAGSALIYDLYRPGPPTYTTIWGDNEGDSTVSFFPGETIASTLGGDQFIKVYGKVPIQTITVPGTYTDQVKITYTF
jgi:spore coat protein U-like protein